MDRPITIDHDLLELMPDMVTIERCTGYDAYGQRQYDSRPFKVRCRIEGRARKVVASDGQERVSSMQVYLAEAPSLSPLDRLTLPRPWLPTQPNILSIDRQSDEHGDYYEAVYS